MKKILCALGVVAAMGFVARGDDWKPVANHIMTKWAAKVDPSNPLPEYPRPQMERKNWTSLNGLWSYAIVASNAPQPEAWDGKILVPYPVESALSGVAKALKPEQKLWYRRTFKAPGVSDGERVLLHFEAVDWEATVIVNGKQIGSHRGGFDAFSFDITDALKKGDNDLVVAVFDATGGYQPKGKQHLPAIEHPGGIMYTPCSGIWQTAWLEVVPKCFISDLKIVPDVDGGTVTVTTRIEGSLPAGQHISVTVHDGGKEIAELEAKPGEPLTLAVPNAKLWSPDSPFLYGLTVEIEGKGGLLGEKTFDEVESYFGMRKISLGKDEKGFTRLLLNGKFVFQAGPLDQGFWPDGIYTAPTDEALRFDIAETRRLGFNMTRKHTKVESKRWYYWCDKLGLIVWQDMPAGGAGKGAQKDKKTGEYRDGVPASEEAGKNFEAELKAMIEQHWNNPSIIMWIVFNEGWGQHDTVRHTKWVKEFDPSRLVSCASGWNDVPVGDILDMHNYPGPGCPKATDGRAEVLGEFGGLGLAITNHTWVEKSWGYRGVANEKALTKKYVDLWRKTWQLCTDEGLNAAVYTQLTDCETECNGLFTYDRAVCKVDVAEVADAHNGKFKPMPVFEDVVPTSQTSPANWKFTEEKPADDWFKSGFNDSSWKEGPAGFGNGDTKLAEKRTAWKSPDIWVRRTITLPAGKLKNPALKIFHDEDADVYLNGIPAAKLGGFTTDFETVEISEEAAASLKPGANVIAIHVRQTMGGQYIDCGIVSEK